MQEYYFLFGLALVWVIFATIQDLRKREVANWLTYSLIVFGLAYRAFYSIIQSDWMFFVCGLAGFGIFLAFAYAFYYGRVFAGGDAKLLMGLGAIIPGRDFTSLGINMILFLFLLFFLGAVYSLLFSLGIVYSRYKMFKPKFEKRLLKQRKTLRILGTVYLAIIVLAVFNRIFEIFTLQIFGYIQVLFYTLSFVLAFTLLYNYLKALEEGCLIVRTSPWKLGEGDWLERDVKVNGRWIRKSVHGLSFSEIKLLRKAKKEVWIKQGIPFVPAFLMALVVIGYLTLFLGLDGADLFRLLSKTFG